MHFIYFVVVIVYNEETIKIEGGPSKYQLGLFWVQCEGCFSPPLVCFSVLLRLLTKTKTNKLFSEEPENKQGDSSLGRADICVPVVYRHPVASTWAWSWHTPDPSSWRCLNLSARMALM